MFFGHGLIKIVNSRCAFHVFGDHQYGAARFSYFNFIFSFEFTIHTRKISRDKHEYVNELKGLENNALL